MAYENLDAQDQEICKAIEAGDSNETLAEKFPDAGADKFASLRGVVESEKAAADGGAPAPSGDAAPKRYKVLAAIVVEAQGESNDVSYDEGAEVTLTAEQAASFGDKVQLIED